MTTSAVIGLTDSEREHVHAIYHHLHANPELSMQEHATADFIAARLDDLGIENFRCGGTGVVGVLRNGNGPVVAFRADIDGLPIAEDTGLEYASTRRGRLDDGTDVPVMHGCGHDTHVASLLGATTVLDREASNWSGTLILIFQPGEETAAGARAMVGDGLWDRVPRPDVVLGQHIMPLDAGKVTITSGPAMAMADALRVTVTGRQSHGSQPQHAIDPIVLAAHIVTRLQTIISREISPQQPAVLTVGTFHAGLKENIIPDQAEFTINVRSLTNDVRRTVLTAIERIIAAECAASAAPEPTIEKLYDFPECYNDPAATKRTSTAIARALGAENVTASPPMMGSEDFGHLAASIGVPSVFWMFGGFTDEPRGRPVNHSPYFAPAMKPTLETGVSTALAALFEWLGPAVNAD